MYCKGTIKSFGIQLNVEMKPVIKYNKFDLTPNKKKNRVRYDKRMNCINNDHGSARDETLKREVYKKF